LKGGIDRETAVELPEGHTKAAKAVAEQQTTLAGYRLADEIKKWVRLELDHRLVCANIIVKPTVLLFNAAPIIV
jgi:hypothetical protein